MFKLRDWFVLGPAAVCALILGVIGFMTCSDTHCHVDGFGQALIRSFTLLKGGDFYPPRDPWTLVIAQYLVPGIAIWAAGKLFFANLRRDFRVALARRQHDHTIVCGLGATGRQIVENLHNAGQPIVAITLDTETPEAAACESLGIPVLKGSATRTTILAMAGLLKARRLIATSGSDSVNVEIGLRAAKLREAHALEESTANVRAAEESWIEAISRNITITGLSRTWRQAKIRTVQIRLMCTSWICTRTQTLF